tara:strand:+ start:87 stop:1076 length:990 start_codon:yes stop_codon:yes gene_type:complete
VNSNNTRSFQFTYEVDIEPTNGKKLEVWIPIPTSNEVQTISALKINTNGLEYSLEDEKVHGNKYLYINQLDGTTESKKVSVIFDVVRKEHQNVHYENVDPNEYLDSYNSVPVGGVFNKVIEENKLSKNNVRQIYDYVLNGMHYGKPKSVDNQYYKDPWLNADGKYGLKEVSRDEVVNLYQKAKKEKSNYTFGNGNSIYACDIGVGNCTDYHSYFMSLDRTMGIPARFHMGFPIPDGESGKVGGYHCWADYYIENKGWYPVDISEADKDPEKIDYFFGTVCNNRVEMMVGRDFKLKGHELDFVNLFIYPIMEINDKASYLYKKNFTYKNL